MDLEPQPEETAAAKTGTAALVIIPQHSTKTSVDQNKIATKFSPITTTAHAYVTLAATTNSKTIQLQAPITTHVSNINAPIPLTAHQQSVTTQSIPIQLPAPITTHIPNVNAPIPLIAHQQSATIIQPTLTETNLPVVPVTTTTASIKSEVNKIICCLLDNGVRCDRVAGNASFSARIQKIVGTKKMNFALDPTVRHAYICEHHKAIITVAKKSTTLTRDNKAEFKNYSPTTKQFGNYNDLTRQRTLNHPVDIELLNNQNRTTNNNGGPMNSLQQRPGTQLAYPHYSGPHPNQVTSINVMKQSSFDSSPVGLGSEIAPSSSASIDVDLQQLQVNTLRRYKRHFRVQTRPGLNKMQLAESLKSHFRTLPIIEKEAITYFVYIVKCYRNKLDHNPKAD